MPTEIYLAKTVFLPKGNSIRRIGFGDGGSTNTIDYYLDIIPDIQTAIDDGTIVVPGAGDGNGIYDGSDSLSGTTIVTGGSGHAFSMRLFDQAYSLTVTATAGTQHSFFDSIGISDSARNTIGTDPPTGSFLGQEGSILETYYETTPLSSYSLLGTESHASASAKYSVAVGLSGRTNSTSNTRPFLYDTSSTYRFEVSKYDTGTQYQFIDIDLDGTATNSISLYDGSYVMPNDVPNPAANEIIEWQSGVPVFIPTPAGAGNTLYSANDIIGSGRVATLTDTVQFTGGTSTFTHSGFPVLAIERTTTTLGGSFDDTTGLASGVVLRTQSSGDMTDAFGGGFLFYLEDNVYNGSPNNAQARIYARRDGADTQAALQFFTNVPSTPKLTIRQDGKVGIGTTAPEELLHVSGGTVKIEASDLFGGTFGALTFNHTSITAVDNKDNYGLIGFGSSVSGTEARGLAVVGLTDRTFNPGVSLYSRSLTDNTTDAAAVRIDGRLAATPGSDWTSGAGSPLTARNILDVSNAGIPVMVVSPDGHVGIGSNPSALLNNVQLQVIEEGGHGFGAFQSYSNTATDRGILYFLHSRGTVALPTEVQSGDYLGSINFAGQKNTVFNGINTGAQIHAEAAENWTSLNNGTDLVFSGTDLLNNTLSEYMRITAGGNVGIGNDAPSSLVEINDGGEGITTLSGSAFITLSRYRTANNGSGLTGRRARGTQGAPTAVLLDDQLFQFGAAGYDGTAFSGTRARLNFYADGNFSGTSHPTRLEVSTTPTGSITDTRRFSINNTGEVGIGPSLPASGNILTVEAGTEGLYNINGTSAAIESLRATASTSGAFLTGKKARGTIGAETATVSGDDLFTINSGGHDGTSYTGGTGRIQWKATENFTGIAQGTELVFELVPNGSTTRAQVFKIFEDGDTLVGLNGGVSGDTTAGYKFSVNGESNGNFGTRIFNSSTGTNAASQQQYRVDATSGTVAFYGSAYAGIVDDAAGAMTLGSGSGPVIIMSNQSAVSGGNDPIILRAGGYTNPMDTLIADDNNGLTFPRHGSGTFTGTSAYPLHITSAGKVIEYTKAEASMRLAGGSSTTTAGTPAKIDSSSAGTTTSLRAVDFTIATGRLTYNGTDTKDFIVIVSLSGSTSSAADMYYYIAENGTVIAGSVMERIHGNTDVGSISLNYLVTLATNDYIEIFNEAQTGTETFNNANCIVSIFEA